MNQKLICDFMNIGCPTKRDAAIALQVYLELCEVKKYFDVEYHFSDGLKCMYITGKKTKSSDVTIFIPIAISESVTFLQMEEYLNLSNSNQKSVILAIVDSDSTCVYYEITSGIKDPIPETPPPDIEAKRARLDMELRKSKELLEQSAMYGLPITLNKETRKKDKPKDTE